MKYLDELIDAVKNQDSVKLRELAGLMADDAALNQKQESIDAAVISYCLHKIFLKNHFRDISNDLLQKTLDGLSITDYHGVLNEIEIFDEEHGLLEGNLKQHAKVKIGARLHSRGLSLKLSAHLVGKKVSDLMAYVGETREYNHHHSNEGGMKLAERLNTARDILSKPNDGL